jgi:hypothetical protein
MRTTALHRSLLSALVLLAAACDNSDSTFEPPAVFDAAPEAAPEAEPVPEDPRGLAAGRWADGYALAQYPLTSSYAPPPQGAYNRSGGPITVTKVAGTTGRYVVTFAGLSSLVGSRNTVRVTSHGTELNYCKPMTGSLASDKVEVRCFKPGTGSAANASFSVLVLGALRHGPTRTATSRPRPATARPARVRITPPARRGSPASAPVPTRWCSTRWARTSPAMPVRCR